MNIEALIAAKKASRAANGLHVRLTFVGNVREPFNYFAKDAAARDEYLAKVRPLIGAEDKTGLGHVIEAVEVVA